MQIPFHVLPAQLVPDSLSAVKSVACESKRPGRQTSVAPFKGQRRPIIGDGVFDTDMEQVVFVFQGFWERGMDCKLNTRLAFFVSTILKWAAIFSAEINQMTFKHNAPTSLLVSSCNILCMFFFLSIYFYSQCHVINVSVCLKS